MKQNQKEDSLFSPAPFFMIRTPLLPVEEFFRLLNQTDSENYLLSFYAHDETLREAIAIASPNLHEALQNITGKNGREREQIVSSLLKYYLRMATRSTPFGLFAFVSQGKWDETTSVIFDHRHIEKRSRPDMEWLFKIIDNICAQSECFNYLPIKANPLLFRNGNRIILNYTRKNETDKKQKNVSISATLLVITILASCKDSITMDQLIEKVLEQIPSLESEKIRVVILKLLEQQILLFTLLPSLLTKSPFQDLLAKLSHYQAMQNDSHHLQASSLLKEISLKISAYNSQNTGEHILQDVQSTMQALTPSPHFVQVDSSYRGGNLTLNRTVAAELASAAEILWRLSYRIPSNLHLYHAKFLQKYGARQVPLLELLSDEGLGIPETYTKSSAERIEPSSKEINWLRWLKKECCKCLHERSKEITLTDQLIDKILGPPVDKEKAPLSFDLFCEIVAESPEHIDREDFLLNIFNKTGQAGSTFGRFIDILGENTEASLRNFYFQEEGLEENCLFIESSYLPSSPRYANVANHPNLRKYAIDFGGNSSESVIPLEDFIIGALGDRFYISLKNVNKELIVLAGNVLNPTSAPIPLKFLRDVSHARYHAFEIFSWHDLDPLPFLPRIKYKKSILSPAQWKVDLEQIEATTKDSLAKIRDKFLKWAANWEMPRYVFLTYGDNRILLDYQKPEHFQEIILELKKNKEVKLVEKIGQEQGEWVKSLKGRHFSEFVVPFLKNKKYQPSTTNFSVQKQDPTPLANRWKLPGSDWLFIKFYLPQEQEISFLLQQLSGFAKHFQDQGIISGWFFIRYLDHSPHIRVRFRNEKEKDKMLAALIPAIHDWSLLLLQNKLIHDIHIASYEREMERYGGEEVIELAENFFCADASTSIDLLGVIEETKLPLPDFAVTALSLIDLLKGFGMKLQEMITFLKSGDYALSELKGFREVKKEMFKIAAMILEDAQNSAFDFLDQAFNKRKNSQYLYNQKIIENHRKGLLSNSLESIQSSLLHMHCNRLLGNQIQLEKKARLYALHTLQHLLNVSFFNEQA